MRNMFKVISIIVLMIGLSFSTYSNGLNLNGMGTKAISMGGAFIAVADDYSAVFWNPAGLTQMDKANLSVFSSIIIPTGTYQYAPAGIDMETESKMFPAPALTYYKPLSDKLVFGLTVYATSGAGAYWDGAPLVPFNTGFPANTKVYTWESQEGGITFSPVVAYKVSDKFSLGVTLNVTYGML
ncbi:MAG: outer membrane protein transport protein, partial [Candidatus Aminicenantes bacterium]|nr:outer membrane protein transport protein [Candidatus Aminicenantes bacterium]